MKLTRWHRFASIVAALFLGLSLTSRAFADAVLEGEKWTDKIKFNGDIRLRHESFYVKTNRAGAGVSNAGNDRDRERLRLRFGVTANIQDITAGFRLASGVGEQVSTNQTYQNVFNQKGLFIDQAYIGWKAHEYVKLTGGKMPNPFWRTYASDVMWDDDVNPEGYAESFEMPVTDRANLFVNFGQFVLTEGASNPVAWMFGNQIGSNLKVTEDTRLTGAMEYYGFTNEKTADFIATGAPATAGVRQAGNTRVGTTAQLATGLRLIQFTGELASHIGPVPVTLDGDYIRNSDAFGSIGKSGYQTGVIVGKAKAAKTWEAAYFFKYLGTNASYADIADSDFGYSGNGGGGTNRKGHIMWLAYAPRDYITLKAKYFITDVLDVFVNQFGQRTTTNQANSINRFQLDAVVKF